MKIEVQRDVLLHHLSIASRAISAKNPIPVLAHFKLVVDDKGLTIIASNNELSISTRIPIVIEGKTILSQMEQGGTLVNAKVFSEITRKVTGESLTIELFDGTVVQVGDGRSMYKLNSVKVEEYPELDFDLTGVRLELNGKMFKRMIEQTAFAASTKEQRPIMTAVNLSVGEGKIVATATDSARLSRKELAIDQQVTFVANVPAKALIEITSMVEGQETIVLATTDKRIAFEFGTTVVMSRLVGGEYPNTSNIIPKTSNFYLVVNAKELSSAIERVSVLTVERENVIKLSMSESTVELSSKSAQIGSAKEALTHFSFNGDQFEISFNAHYLMEAIKAADAEDVKIGFLGEMRPFVIKNDKDDTLVQLATPVRTY